MTSLQEFIERFTTQIYSATSVSSMGWENEEICEFLNTAQLLLVEEAIGAGNFEIIAETIKTVPTVMGTPNDNLVPFTHSEDSLMFVIGGIVKYSKDSVSRIGALDKIQHSDLPYLVSDVMLFRNPKLVIQPEGSNQLEVLVDSLTSKVLVEVDLRCVVEPIQFSINPLPDGEITNLNPLLHTRIVSTAVEIAAKTMLTQQQSTQ